jgi:hypothetical protein
MLRLIVDHLVQRLDKETRGHHFGICRGHCLGLLPQRFLNCIGAGNCGIKLAQ